MCTASLADVYHTSLVVSSGHSVPCAGFWASVHVAQAHAGAVRRSLVGGHVLCPWHMHEPGDPQAGMQMLSKRVESARPIVG